MISKIFKSLILIILSVIISALATIQFGGVHYFVSPFLKGIFEEYVPNLEFDKIKYSLLDHEVVRLTNVRYKVAGLPLQTKEAKLHVLNLEELLKSINSESTDIFRDILFTVDTELDDLNIASKSLDLFKVRVHKPFGQKIFFQKLHNERLAKDSKLDLHVDVENERFVFEANNVSLGKILSFINKELSITGLVDGRGFVNWRSGTRGYLQLSSKNFYFNGIQLDKILETFSKPAKTSAVDVATYVALGPVGLLTSSVTQMGGGLLLYSGGETFLEDINITISLFEDKLNFNDVAFSTKFNRASLSGYLDIDDLSFVDTQFYILDNKNCALLSQEVTGTVLDPKLQPTVTFIRSLVSPFVSLAKSTRLFSCEKVYSGKVKHPKGKKK
jgi:hypothetical protein